MVSGFITVGRDTAAFESWSGIQPQANCVLCRPLDKISCNPRKQDKIIALVSIELSR